MTLEQIFDTYRLLEKMTGDLDGPIGRRSTSPERRESDPFFPPRVRLEVQGRKGPWCDTISWMTTQRIKKDASYEDLIAIPEHLVAEILDGNLVTSPRPAPRHSRTGSSLGGELWGPFDRGRNGPGGWWIMDEPELHLGKDVLVPDLAGWRRDRMPGLPDEAFFSLVPDWICEILSPSTARHDRIDKMPAYARHGAKFLWLVDPLARSLEIFVLEEARWSLHATHADDEVIRGVPFEALELSLTPLWDVGEESGSTG